METASDASRYSESFWNMSDILPDRAHVVVSCWNFQSKHHKMKIPTISKADLSERWKYFAGLLPRSENVLCLSSELKPKSIFVLEVFSTKLKGKKCSKQNIFLNTNLLALRDEEESSHFFKTIFFRIFHYKQNQRKNWKNLLGSIRRSFSPSFDLRTYLNNYWK